MTDPDTTTSSPGSAKRVRIGLAVTALIGALGMGLYLGAGLVHISQLEAGRVAALSSAEHAALIRAATGVGGSLLDVNSSFAAQGTSGAGTGIVVADGNIVVTNNHVIAGATFITATSPSTGVTYPATVLGYDRVHDVAVIQLRGASGLRPITWGSGSIGDAVVGVGNKGGQGATYASPGRIIATGATIHAADSLTGATEILHGLLATNAPVGAGDSGGPLLDEHGHVVGLDVASGTLRHSTIGYAIPSARVREVLAAVLSGHSSGSVHVGATAHLGVLIDPRWRGRGARVVGVLAGPVAGLLKPGDVITALAGMAVTSSGTLSSDLESLSVGARVPLTWQRGSTTEHSTITLDAGPAL